MLYFTMSTICTDYNVRATAKLSDCNHFERLARDMEASICMVVRIIFSGFPRKEMCSSFRDVGNKLSMKQRQFERYENWINHYDSDFL